MRGERGSTMRAVLLGPPGAGKGTQAALIQERVNVPHISTGDLLRRAVAERTPLGVKVKDYMDRGDLVPDDLVVGLIEERLAKDRRGAFLLDGFPRNVAQAKTLERLLTERGMKLEHVISLTVPREELVKRMLGRGRTDDNEETIRSRLLVYEEETAPLCDFYRRRSILREVDGTGSREAILENILDTLRQGRGRRQESAS